VQPPGRFDLLERIINALVIALPAALVIYAAVLAWNHVLGWSDIAVFVLCYVPTGLGITVGFHRLFTHRSFKTTEHIRVGLAILGSAAVEGPVIEWVANHRKHHAFSDMEGDPHSPHVGHGDGPLAAVRGLWHAHVGWLFRSDFANQERYAPDLVADPKIDWVDNTFVWWVFAGLAVPFALGYLFTGRLSGALTGLLWGGAVRIFVLHHVTFSINSLCHYYGRRRFRTGDESRNLAWLAPLSFGEAWHNNHHAFPTSAYHGLRWWEFDVSALVIRGLHAAGLAWDVVEVSPERQATKQIAG
jgi:stearoyl-CoA desaturase (delta-9 desaturase)